MAGLLDPSMSYFCSRRRVPQRWVSLDSACGRDGGLAAEARKPLLRSGPRFAPLRVHIPNRMQYRGQECFADFATLA